MKLPLFQRSQLDLNGFDLAGLPTRYMNPGELEVLIALIGSVKPEAVLEFGCNSGRTAMALMRNISSINQYQGIDVEQGYVPSMKVQRNEVPTVPGELALEDKRFELILRKFGSLDLSAKELKPCDAVFIDGDHGRRAVTHDAALARQLVRPGGIIVYHDYHDHGTVDVRDVLDEMFDEGRLLQHVEGTWLAFEHV